MLERRLKNYLILYDDLVVQDGRYLAKHSASGSFDHYESPSLLSDRSEVAYYSADDPFVVQVSKSPEGPFYPVFSGPITASYEVDFFPLLHDAGLVSAPFVQWWDIDISQASRKAAHAMANADLADHSVTALMPREDRFVRSRVLSALYIDSILARELGTSFSVDPHVAPIINWKISQFEQHWAVDLTSRFHRTWISLKHPDFGDESWDDVIRARESAPGRAFRAMVGRVVNAAADAFPNVDSHEELREILCAEFHQEVVNEYKRFMPTAPDAVLNVGLNLIPGGGFVSGAKDALKLVLQRRSWTTFLGGLPKGMRIGK